MKKVSLLVIVITFGSFLPVAQGLELFNNEKSSLDFKGNLSIYYIKSAEEAEINDGFSRFTFDLKHQMKNDWTALGLIEWGIQVSRTDDQLFVSNHGLTSSGPTGEAVWLRRGYVGVQHVSYGRFTIGKQWGVSYDVAGVTDWFEIFGADAQGTYNFNTDGGLSGTGRAEQSIQYKLNYQKFSFGVQYLVSDDVLSSDNTIDDDGFEVKFNDSFGLSVIYQAPFEIGLGLAYNKAKISLAETIGTMPNPIQTPKADDQLITAHITYRTYGNLGLHVAIVYTDMTNHEINDVGTIMNDSTGIELFSAYRFDNDISLIFGYNSLKDNSNSLQALNHDYHLNYYILSAKYQWDEDFYVYIESKIDDSTFVEQPHGLGENATGIGFMFVF